MLPAITIYLSLRYR